MQGQRAHWGSRAGFILAAAGSAIGLGNIWKFPYITGENGGGWFVLIYLICIDLVGIPIPSACSRAGSGRRRILTSHIRWTALNSPGIALDHETGHDRPRYSRPDSPATEATWTH